MLCLGVMNQRSTSVADVTNKAISPEQRAVLECLLYFDTFSYPLTCDELFQYCSLKLNDSITLELMLNDLQRLQLINKKGAFYFVNEDHRIVERRLKGNKMAQDVMPKALRYGRFIAQFPFVETVCISGSLSKNYFDEKGDVDFFIVTKSQRLWLCRSLLVAFKKLFLLNSRKYFCVNYFVANDNLSIPDRNVFTATEIASLIPVNNLKGYYNFIAHNQWIYEQLPNFDMNKKASVLNNNANLLKKAGEAFFSNKLGVFADKQLFKLTLSIWHKKFNHFNKDDFDLNMRTRKNVSKHHPSGFQQKVLKQWALNKEAYFRKHRLLL